MVLSGWCQSQHPPTSLPALRNGNKINARGKLTLNGPHLQGWQNVKPQRVSCDHLSLTWADKKQRGLTSFLGSPRVSRRSDSLAEAHNADLLLLSVLSTHIVRFHDVLSPTSQ